MKEQLKTNPYSEIVRSEPFTRLMAKKKRFIVPMTLFFLIFYFILPIMTSYSKVLNEKAFGAITWAWLLASAQFIMTWVLCWLYSRKAVEFDRLAEQIKVESNRNERKAG
ncbi:DUF485 domain-containing protein [Paenibacillus aestuarii]|uniref:DUF485 domain-containing protein n=1 Tax=Paenibacillus aestuarii TaxID=516965 RepID=A0ABW0KAS3_9BACL|nr:DUF485 domain-containing protein [Paenibacillus aestuarii]